MEYMLPEDEHWRLLGEKIPSFEMPDGSECSEPQIVACIAACWFYNKANDLTDSLTDDMNIEQWTRISNRCHKLRQEGHAWLCLTRMDSIEGITFTPYKGE